MHRRIRRRLNVGREVIGLYAETGGSYERTCAHSEPKNFIRQNFHCGFP
jgi:hypothetical protein